MATRSDITPELCRQLLRYEPETGKLYWRERSVELFSDNARYSAARMCLMWNTRHAGSEAFCTISAGYRVSQILDMPFRAHRVAWAIVTGQWPADQVDHINGVRSDNRWCNLREADDRENAVNKGRQSRNASGCTGVRWHKHRGYWEAFITRKRRFTTIGCFKTIEEAIAARKAAERRLGFHPNHDRPMQCS